MEMWQQRSMETLPPDCRYSRVSSATAFLAQASSTISLPSDAAAIGAATATLLRAHGCTQMESQVMNDDRGR